MWLYESVVKGQASLEALVGFGAFLAVLALFASALSGTSLKAEQGSLAFAAKVEAGSCAAVVDSFYSNGGGRLEGFSAECFVKGPNLLAARAHDFEKHSAIVNQRTFQHGGGIVVRAVEHYG